MLELCPEMERNYVYYCTLDVLSAPTIRVIPIHHISKDILVYDPDLLWLQLHSETTTALNYNFELERGDSGYIGIVNAQISATVRLSMCKCLYHEYETCTEKCIVKCRWASVEIGHHKKVILKNEIPRGYVAICFHGL